MGKQQFRLEPEYLQQLTERYGEHFLQLRLMFVRKLDEILIEAFTPDGRIINTSVPAAYLEKTLQDLCPGHELPGETE